MNTMGSIPGYIPYTEINHFLNYLNALMFGVEASRINTTFLTGIMTLELIQAEAITYKNAFSKNEYGGIFPLATINTGSRNFKARGELLKINHIIGLRLDRQYPQWLNVHLEAKIIKIWLKMKKKINRDMLLSDIRLQLDNSIIDIFKEYYDVNISKLNNKDDDLQESYSLSLDQKENSPNRKRIKST